LKQFALLLVEKKKFCSIYSDAQFQDSCIQSFSFNT